MRSMASLSVSAPALSLMVRSRGGAQRAEAVETVRSSHSGRAAPSSGAAIVNPNRRMAKVLALYARDGRVTMQFDTNTNRESDDIQNLSYRLAFEGRGDVLRCNLRIVDP